MKSRLKLLAGIIAALGIVVLVAPEDSEARRRKTTICHTDTAEEQQAHAGDPDYEPTKTIRVSDRSASRHFREHSEDYEGYCGGND